MLKTNDQYKPPPPENAPSSLTLSPMGTVGTEKTVNMELAEHNQKISQRKQEILALTKKGGLTQEFNRQNDNEREN